MRHSCTIGTTTHLIFESNPLLKNTAVLRKAYSAKENGFEKRIGSSFLLRKFMALDIQNNRTIPCLTIIGNWGNIGYHIDVVAKDMEAQIADICKKHKIHFPPSKIGI